MRGRSLQFKEDVGVRAKARAKLSCAGMRSSQSRQICLSAQPSQQWNAVV
jgi:hypothetical protein